MFDFDEIIDRRGTHCSKWDMMEPIYRVSPEDGLAMWVADMDFRPPAAVTGALRAEIDHGLRAQWNQRRDLKTVGDMTRPDLGQGFRRDEVDGLLPFQELGNEHIEPRPGFT